MITSNFHSTATEIVYVAERWPCPCGRLVKAHDVRRDGAEIAFVCDGCHRTLISIVKKQAGVTL